MDKALFAGGAPLCVSAGPGLLPFGVAPAQLYTPCKYSDLKRTGPLLCKRLRISGRTIAAHLRLLLSLVSFLSSFVLFSTIDATMEKEGYHLGDSPDGSHDGGARRGTYVDPATGVETKRGRIAEGAEIFGNIEEAEEYGYVTRGYVLESDTAPATYTHDTLCAD